MRFGNIVVLAAVILTGFVLWMGFAPDRPASGGASAGSSDFEAALASGRPVLVDFYADW